MVYIKYNKGTNNLFYFSFLQTLLSNKYLKTVCVWEQENVNTKKLHFLMIPHCMAPDNGEVKEVTDTAAPHSNREGSTEQKKYLTA